MAASGRVLSSVISKRLSLVKPACRDAWPWRDVDPQRILVLLLPWLNAQDKHVARYTGVYSDLGLDVLTMKSSVGDFLWPPRSVKAATHLIQVLQEQCDHYDHLCLHSMSVGTYNTTTFRMLLNQPEPEANDDDNNNNSLRSVDRSSKILKDKIRGIIYDSFIVGGGKGGIVKAGGGDGTEGNSGKSPKRGKDGGKGSDGTEGESEESPKRGKDGGKGIEGNEGEGGTDALDLMVKGMARSVSNHPAVFNILNRFVQLYFVSTKSTTLDFYAKAYDVVRDQPLKVPTLLFCSKDDPMCDYKVVENLIDIWKGEHSVPVRLQLWDKSKHAQHLVYHREDYLKAQRQFLSELFDKS